MLQLAWYSFLRCYTFNDSSSVKALCFCILCIVASCTIKCYSTYVAV